MFVSLNSSLTRQMDWPDFARLAAKLGYGGVDVNLSAARMMGVEETKGFLGSLKVRPGIVSLPVRYSNPDEGVYLADMKQLDESAKFAAAIGCRA